MSNTLKAALKEKGINASYEGNPARLLVLGSTILSEFPGLAKMEVGTRLSAGDMIVTWRAEDGKQRGEVLDPLAENDLEIMVRRMDGEDDVIDARYMGNAIERLAGMVKEDRELRTRLDEENAKAERTHYRAVEAGEVDPEERFEPRLPRYADGAFAGLPYLVEGMKARLSAEYANEFTGLAGKSIAALGEKQLTKTLRDTLTAEERRMAEEAFDLRAERAKLRGEVPVAAPTEREHGNERVEGAMDALSISGEGFSAAQLEAIMPDADLTRKAFKPLTSTSPAELTAHRLSPREANTVLQKLRRHEDTEWAPQAIEKVRRLLQDEMPGYNFSAKIFSRDGADMMLVADHAGSMLYAWDTETRVLDYNPEADLKVFTAEDVPTEEELEALRVEVRDLRYYADGDEIDFSLDDGEEEDALLEG